MGSSPNKKSNEGVYILNRKLLEMFNKIPATNYTCTKCKLIPEILDINFNESTITFKCLIHGEKTLKINDYLNNEYKNSSKIECKYVNSHKKKKDKNNYIISNYCSDCNSYICQSCSTNHGHKTIDLKDFENINPSIKPTDNVIKILKNKRDNLFYCMNLLDILIKTYEKDNSNINNNNNILNVLKSIQGQNNNEALKKKFDNVQTKLRNHFKKGLNIEITGKEEILDLSNRNITNVELNLLSGMDLQNLKILDLRDNYIENLDSLENTNINLESIDLRNNRIKDIKPIKNISNNNKNLRNINLSKNLIVNVDILKQNISKIKIKLNLDDNRIIQKDFEEIKSIIGSDFNELILTYTLNKLLGEINIFGEKFVKNNQNYCKLTINDEPIEFKEIYKNKNKSREITIKLNMNKNVTNMSYMFYNCSSLLTLENYSELDISNVTDMSYMFYGCTNLHNINNYESWDTSKVKNMSHMFYQCLSIEFFDGKTKWNISSVDDMSYMFYECEKLKYITNIQFWNTANVTNMSHMFYGCSSLSNLYGVNKWIISKLIKKDDMFHECTNITNDVLKHFD